MTPDRASRLRHLALLVLGTAAAYLALLGWDQALDVDPATGSGTGPYQAWQVVVLAAVLVGLAAWAVSQPAPRLVLVVPAVLTVCWTVDAATDTDGDGLWPIGAVLVATGSFPVAGLLLAVGHACRMLASRDFRARWLRHRWGRASQRGLALTLLRPARSGPVWVCCWVWSGTAGSSPTRSREPRWPRPVRRCCTCGAVRPPARSGPV